jgi:hypothetical protein
MDGKDAPKVFTLFLLHFAAGAGLCFLSKGISVVSTLGQVEALALVSMWWRLSRVDPEHMVVIAL